MPPRPRTRGGKSQSWATFFHNHAGAVLACDFFVVVTATFQRFYVFVVLDITTRRVVHWNLHSTRRRLRRRTGRAVTDADAASGIPRRVVDRREGPGRRCRASRAVDWLLRAFR